jgi:membrane-associated phospholipid phosphatase
MTSHPLDGPAPEPLSPFLPTRWLICGAKRGFWVLLRWLFAASRRAFVVLVVLAALPLISRNDVEKTGDNLQIALPLLAWGCAAVNGDGAEYLGRYAVMFLATRLGKDGLGDAAINQRPNGHSEGMPSAHTSTATLGASRLATQCLGGNPAVQVGTVLSAGFVGLSRVDAGAHTTWQVIWGAILGLLCDRAFGKDSASRKAVLRQCRRLRRKFTRLPMVPQN